MFGSTLGDVKMDLDVGSTRIFPFGEVSTNPGGGKAEPLSAPDTQPYEPRIRPIISNRGP